MCLLAVRPGPVHGLDVFPNASGVYVSFNSPKRGKTLKYNVSAVCGEDGLYEVNWLTLRFAGNPVVPLPSMVETARILCTAGSVKWYGIHLSVGPSVCLFKSWGHCSRCLSGKLCCSWPGRQVISIDSGGQ